MNSEHFSILINSIVFMAVVTLTIIYILLLKISSKGYKWLFVTYLIFWIPLMMTREYSGSIQNGIDKNLTWLVLSSYGIIGIFIRPLVDFLSLHFRNRKMILYASVIVTFISFIPFVIHPSTITSVIQSIGIGIGASMIGTYELLFKEQYTENKSYLTVSILALPPLLADFLTSPIQTALTLVPKPTNSNLDPTFLNSFPTILIWIVSMAFLVMCFVMIIFVKEDRTKIGLKLKTSNILSKSFPTAVWITIICLLGFMVSFVKFSNSGSVAILNLEHLSTNIDQTILKGLKGYISLLFSVFQLIGSIIVYYLLIKIKRKEIILLIPIFLWIIYHLLTMIIENPYLYFGLASINGLAYGIIYNLFLALVLNVSFSNNKITPMGLYQGMLSFGIAISTSLTTFIKNNLKNDFTTTNIIVNGTIIGILILMYFLYIISNLIKKKFKIIKSEQYMIKWLFFKLI